MAETMKKKNISNIKLGDMAAVFEQSEDTGKVGFYIMPADLAEKSRVEEKYYRVNNMIQLKIVGDIYPGSYGNGQTMHNSGSTDLMIYRSQKVEEVDGHTEIHTFFKDDRGYTVENVIIYYPGDESFEMKNCFANESSEAVTLEMFSSFEMENLSPFLPGDGAGSLLVHRLLSKWSHEGRLVTEHIEDMQLEPSWSTWSVAVERFGQRGSMPVMKYFPFVAVEDTHACVQHILVGQLSSSVAHVAGLLIVISSADQGLVGHGGVVCLVLGCVQHPLQTHEEVLAGQVSLDFAVHIHPVHIVAEVEGPNGRVLIVAPLLGHRCHSLAVAVKAQQAFPQVGGDIHVGSHLAVQYVPALQLTVGALPGDELLQRGSAGGVGSAGSTRGSSGGAAARVAAAGGQDAGGTNDTGSLQKAAAADCMRLVVVVHCVFLPIIIPCFSAWCRAGCPAVFPLFCGGFLNPVLPWNTKERRNRPLCLHLCSSRKTLTRHILYH